MSSRVEIIVFKIPGCPACMSYVPRLRRRAAAHRSRVPIYVADANAAEHQKLATYYNVQDVPVTIVRRHGTRNALRYVGELSDQQIDWILAVATKYV